MCFNVSWSQCGSMTIFCTSSLNIATAGTTNSPYYTLTTVEQRLIKTPILSGWDQSMNVWILNYSWYPDTVTSISDQDRSHAIIILLGIIITNHEYAVKSKSWKVKTIFVKFLIFINLFYKFWVIVSCICSWNKYSPFLISLFIIIGTLFVIVSILCFILLGILIWTKKFQNNEHKKVE